MRDKVQVKEYLADQEEMEGQNRTYKVLLREGGKGELQKGAEKKLKEKKKGEKERKKGGETPASPPGGCYPEAPK